MANSLICIFIGKEFIMESALFLQLSIAKGNKRSKIIDKSLRDGVSFQLEGLDIRVGVYS